MEYIIGPNGEMYDPKAFEVLKSKGALGLGIEYTKMDGKRYTTREQIDSNMPKEIAPKGLPVKSVTMEDNYELSEEVLDHLRKNVPGYDDYTLTEIMKNLSEAGAFEEMKSEPAVFETIESEPVEIPVQVEEY